MTSQKQPQQTLPPQHQNKQTGIESEMNPLPISFDPTYQGSGKLKGKVAIITGGDSGMDEKRAYMANISPIIRGEKYFKRYGFDFISDYLIISTIFDKYQR